MNITKRRIKEMAEKSSCYNELASKVLDEVLFYTNLQVDEITEDGSFELNKRKEEE